MEEELMYEDIEVPEELSYSMTSQAILKKVMQSWKTLKTSLMKEVSENTKEKINEFNKLLNYFFE